MKKILILLTLCMVHCTLSSAQTPLRAQDFDRPLSLDSIDQQRLPRRCTWGVLFNGNMSNFIMTRDHQTTSSRMRAGLDAGVFAEFWIVRHFLIQPQISFVAEVNKFGKDDVTNDMWSFGFNIPVYFLGQFGNLNNGYFRFGVGPYTHFTFATSFRPDNYEIDPFNAGIAGLIGYEFPIGIQINAQYMVSISDVVSYYKQNPSDPNAPTTSLTTICPQHISLGIAYRFRNSRAEQRRQEAQAKYGARHEERLLEKEPETEYDIQLNNKYRR